MLVQNLHTAPQSLIFTRWQHTATGWGFSISSVDTVARASTASFLLCWWCCCCWCCQCSRWV